jgi:uncharacterized membrane protein
LELTTLEDSLNAEADLMRVVNIGKDLARHGLLNVFGRICIAVAFVGMGIQQWMFEGYLKGLELVPKHIPFHGLCAYVVGALLIAGGALILVPGKTQTAALLLTQVFIFSLLVRRLPGVSAVIGDLGERTVFFETLSLGAGCMMLASMLHDLESAPAKAMSASNAAAKAGRLLFALSMAIFGWTHLLIPDFIATLVPSWIPFPLFWTYVSAIGFLAAAVALGQNRMVRPAASLLGIMFLLWVVTLHGPRVARDPYNADEWNSAFVALAMSGISFAISKARFGERVRVRTPPVPIAIREVGMEKVSVQRESI